MDTFYHSFLIFPVGVDVPTRWDVVKVSKNLSTEHHETHKEKRDFLKSHSSYESAVSFVIEEYKKLK